MKLDLNRLEKDYKGIYKLTVFPSRMVLTIKKITIANIRNDYTIDYVYRANVNHLHKRFGIDVRELVGIEKEIDDDTKV